MAVSMRVMTDADLALGMRLKAEAGWNQTLADWRRFLALSPEGCFVASVDGVDLGTVATFILGDVGWIAMVLVDERSRGQGVGKALMNQALAYLDEQGVQSIRLDATPMGRPVYLKLGFEDQFELYRYAGTLPEATQSLPSSQVADITPADWDALITLDTRQMVTDRSALLQSLLAERDGLALGYHVHGELTGYLLARPGSDATFIGPCLAMDEQAGQALLAMASVACAGQRVIFDTPVSNAHANQWAKQMGLAIQRPLMRMTRGRQMLESVDTLWASSGPEKG